MSFGRGYIPNPKGHKIASFRLHPASVPPSSPPSVNLSKFAPPVMDQGGTGSCTGHGRSCTIYTTFAAAGMPLAFVPSPAEFYRNALAVARIDNAFPLQDIGAMPADVTTGIRLFGTRPIQAPTADGRYSDADPATILDEPKLSDLETESRVKLLDEYAIQTVEDGASPADVIANVRKALAANLAVEICAFVDSKMESWSPTMPPQGECDESDPNGGGHCMSLLGYDTTPDGETIGRIRNSWGIGWGEGGDFYAAESFIASATALTVYNPPKAA